jgi:hypothetical protein
LDFIHEKENLEKENTNTNGNNDNSYICIILCIIVIYYYTILLLENSDSRKKRRRKRQKEKKKMSQNLDKSENNSTVFDFLNSSNMSMTSTTAYSNGGDGEVSDEDNTSNRQDKRGSGIFSSAVNASYPTQHMLTTEDSRTKLIKLSEQQQYLNEKLVIQIPLSNISTSINLFFSYTLCESEQTQRKLNQKSRC